MSLFGKSSNTFVRVSKKKVMPDGVWMKCPDCEQPSYKKEVGNNLNVCPKCGYHFTLDARKRTELLIDEGTFEEHDADMLSVDPLEFKGPKTYKEKLKKVFNTEDLGKITGFILKNGMVPLTTEQRAKLLEEKRKRS